MTVSDAVASRRSVRAYLDQPVPSALIVALLNKAARSPSGGNLQPWRVDLVAGATRVRLMALMERRVAEAPQGETPQFDIYPRDLTEPYKGRRTSVGEAMYGLLGIPRGDRAARLAWFTRNYQLFGAPVGLFVHIDRAMGAPQWADLGMYIQTFLLLAAEAGLATCAQESWALYPDTMREFLGTRDDEVLFCGIALGYEDRAHAVSELRTERVSADHFVTIHE